MEAGYHVMAWRRFKSLTQAEVSRRSGLTRPYLSRLERGEVDPTLSSLRRLAVAMEVGLGQMIDELPPPRVYDRMALDRLARGSLRPGTKGALSYPEIRSLARVVKDRRRALDLYRPRKATSPQGSSGKHVGRWMRARLGEAQWNAFLRRVDKLAQPHAR